MTVFNFFWYNNPRHTLRREDTPTVGKLHSPWDWWRCHMLIIALVIMMSLLVKVWQRGRRWCRIISIDFVALTILTFVASALEVISETHPLNLCLGEPQALLSLVSWRSHSLWDVTFPPDRCILRGNISLGPWILVRCMIMLPLHWGETTRAVTQRIYYLLIALKKTTWTKFVTVVWVYSPLLISKGSSLILCL